MRFNVVGVTKHIYDDYAGGGEEVTIKYNMFSEEDELEEVSDGVYKTGMGEGYALKRFQVGFNCGVAFSYREYSFGVGYVTDFNKIVNPDVDDPVTGRMGVTTISVGYNF